MNYFSQTKLNMSVICEDVISVETLYIISPPQASTLSAPIRGSNIHLLISRASGPSRTMELVYLQLLFRPKLLVSVSHLYVAHVVDAA